MESHQQDGHPAWDRAHRLTRRDLIRYGGALGAMTFAAAASATPLAGAAGASAADRAAARSADGPAHDIVTYKVVNGLSLNLYVWTPDSWEPGQKHAAVVFYHGGGWRGGTWAAFQSHAAYLAQRGLVAISVHYRRSGPVIATLDGIDALNYVFGHVTELGIDRNRIVAAGGSAGGEIALATIRDDLPNSDPTNRPSATILFNPVTNTTGDYPVGWGRYQFANDAEAELYSPYHHLAAGDPPALIMHGTSDTTVSFDNVTDFTEKARDLGNEATLVSYDNQSHGFFNKTQHYSRYYHETVREADRFLVARGYLSGTPTIRPVPPDAVENGGFEQGVKDWSASSGTTWRIIHRPVHDGLLAAAVATAGTSGPALLSQDVTADVRGNGRGEYLLRGWVAAASGTSTEAALSLLVKGTGDTREHEYQIPPATIAGARYAQVSGTRNVTWSGELETARLAVSITSEAFVDDLAAEYLPARIGWWRFADGDGAVLADSSGFGLDGTLTGGTWIAEGPAGDAVRLGGANDRIELPNCFDPGATDFVVRVRLRPEERTSVRQAIVRPSAPAGGTWLSWDPATSRLVSEIDGTELWTESTLPAGRWAAITLVRSRDTVEVYIDGALAAARAATSIPASRSSLLIGSPADATGAESGLIGAVSEVSCWDHVPPGTL